MQLAAELECAEALASLLSTARIVLDPPQQSAIRQATVACPVANHRLSISAERSQLARVKRAPLAEGVIDGEEPMELWYADVLLSMVRGPSGNVAVCLL